MKYIKIGITFVIGIVLIGVLSTVIGTMTQPRDIGESVTFDILTETTVTPGTYNSLIDYLGEVELGNDIDIDFIFNDITYNDGYIRVTTDFIEIYFNRFEYIIIYDNDTWLQDDPQSIIVGVGGSFNFPSNEVVETPTIIKTLLLLIPLVFTASLIGYLSLTIKKGDE